MTESRGFYLWLLCGFLAICLVGGVVTCQSDGSSKKHPEECVLEGSVEVIVAQEISPPPQITHLIQKRRERKW